MNGNRKEIKSFLYLGNTLILAVHAFLMSFFAFTHVSFMVWVNVLSVSVYMVLSLAIKYEKSRTYIFVTLTEIIAHMLLAVACVGWSCGFQYYFFGAMAMVFFTDYFFARAKLKRLNSIVLSLICAASFPAVLILSRCFAPRYRLEDGVALVITVINAMFMFAFAAVCFWLLVSKANYYEDELARQANHDKLTELVNRNYLIEHLQKVYEGEDMADYWLAMMDIDDFKKINDTYGHNCGDYVLKSVAGLISENCCGMIPCRWGGEEFILVGRMAEHRAEGPGSAGFVMEKVRRAVEKYEFRYEGHDIKVTLTIGLARYAKGQSVDEWINAADQKLYQGKQSGKNRLVV
ncbi:MAG: diguanylate cyclase [Butyrivibrio sp.]|nr:diguanylate cyclase [Acetatifactor muris]MCM1558822.1 diguanylate cyclase [Butyrivibrio sp.]